MRLLVQISLIAMRLLVQISLIAMRLLVQISLIAMRLLVQISLIAMRLLIQISLLIMRLLALTSRDFDYFTELYYIEVNLNKGNYYPNCLQTDFHWVYILPGNIGSYIAVVDCQERNRCKYFLLDNDIALWKSVLNKRLLCLLFTGLRSLCHE